MEGASLLFPQNFFSFQHRVSCSLSLALLEEDTHFPKTMKRLEQQLRSLLGSARGGAAGGGEGEARGDSTTPTQTATMRPGEEESAPPSSSRPLAATRFVTFSSFLFARCLPRVVVASLGVAGRQVEQESRLIAARERERAGESKTKCACKRFFRFSSFPRSFNERHAPLFPVSRARVQSSFFTSAERQSSSVARNAEETRRASCEKKNPQMSPTLSIFRQRRP